MEDYIRCPSCKSKKPEKMFQYGRVCCDKCIDYKRAWNKKRSEEINAKYPKTFCEFCKWNIRNENWERHISSKCHQINLQRREG